jgi:hypothetical protein
MRLIIALAIFLLSLFFELVFVPHSLGVYLPLSVWFGGAMLAMFAPKKAAAFAVAGGFLRALFLPAWGGFIFLIFISSAAAVLWLRHFLDGRGFVYDFFVLVFSVLFFEIVAPSFLLFSGFLGGVMAPPSTDYFRYIFPRELLNSIAFVLFAGAVWYLYRERQRLSRGNYV